VEVLLQIRREIGIATPVETQILPEELNVTDAKSPEVLLKVSQNTVHSTQILGMVVVTVNSQVLEVVAVDMALDLEEVQVMLKTKDLEKPISVDMVLVVVADTVLVVVVDTVLVVVVDMVLNQPVVGADIPHTKYNLWEHDSVMVYS